MSLHHKLPLSLGVPMLLALFCCAVALPQMANESTVKGNRFVSLENPAIAIRVDQKFRFIGSFPFRIDDTNAGYRYVFVDANSQKHIHRMFIMQQEGFLPAATDTYKYQISNPVRIGNADYRHSVILEDNAKTIRDEPGKEADLTAGFLTKKGYTLESELVMARFARPTDEARKHEIILFYFENLSDYGQTLSALSDAANDVTKTRIKEKVDTNSRTAFFVE